MRQALDMPVFFLVSVAAFIGGALPVVVKIGVTELSPLLFAAARFCVSILILFPLINEQRRLRLLSALSNKTILFSIIANAANIIFFVFAIRSLSPVLAQIMYLLCPLMIYVGEVVFFKDEVSIRNVAGVCLGFMGAFIAILGYGSFDLGFSSAGLIYMILALLAFSAYGLASRHVRHKIGAIEQTFSMSIAVVVFSVLVSLSSNNVTQQVEAITFSGSLLFSVLYTGIMGGAVFYAILQHIIRLSDATAAAMVLYIQPFTAMIVAYLLLEEPLLPLGALGAVISVFGAYLVTSRKRV